MARRHGALKVRGQWFAGWTCTEGHEHRKLALPENTAKEARDLAGTKREEVRQARYLGRACCPHVDKVVKPRTVEELVQDFLEATKTTKQSHKHDVTRVKRIRSVFGSQAASTVTVKAVEDFKLALAAEFSEANANQYLKLLKAVYNRGRRHGWVVGNPVSAVKLYTERNARSRCLSPEEEARLLGKLPEWLCPLVIVATHTGMRKSELLNMRWQDVDFATGTVPYPAGQSGYGP